MKDMSGDLCTVLCRTIFSVAMTFGLKVRGIRQTISTEIGREKAYPNQRVLK